MSQSLDIRYLAVKTFHELSLTANRFFTLYFLTACKGDFKGVSLFSGLRIGFLSGVGTWIISA